MTTVTILQKSIVKALETGQDPAPLLKELAELRAKIAAEGELAELKKIADERQALRDKSAKIQEKVKLQDKAIETFLKLRDSIISPLTELLEKSRELPKLQEECYLNYHDAFVFGAHMRQIPKGYLSADFNCPILEMTDGKSPTYNKASEALWYLQAGYSILTNLKKGEMRSTTERPAGEFDGDLEVETEAENCIVCSHAEVETINSLLRQGKPLRQIESEFDVSRSSLSRHKNRCLNMGAIRITDAT